MAPNLMHQSRIDFREAIIALCQEIFDIAVTQIESVVEPDSVGDYVRRESVAFVGIHDPSLPTTAT